MEETLDLKQIRQKAMKAYFSDGIWETLIGFMLTLIGTFKLIDHFTGAESFEPAFFSIFIVFTIIFVRRFKEKVTFPRIGYVDVNYKIGKFRQKHLLVAIMIGMLMLMLVCLLNINKIAGWLNLQQTDISGQANSIAFISALFIGAMISTIGFLRSAPRMHYASALMIIVFYSLHFFHVYPGFGFVITGMPLLIAGLIIMNKFIRNNPVVNIEEPLEKENNG